MRKKRQPEYRRLAFKLKKDIFEGRLKSGDKLPGEFELAETHGLSRTTARLAVRELESESLVYRRRGSGTFVRNTTVLSSPFSMFARTKADGMVRRVLTQQWIEADNELASILGIPLGSALFAFRRLDVLEGVPVAFDDGWIVGAYAHRLGREDLEVLEFWEHWQREQNLVVLKSDLEIGAEKAGDERAGILKVPPDSPVLVEYSNAFTAEGGACRFVTCYRHDAYRYRRVFHYNGDIQIADFDGK
ncbi:MAG: GntR family transcriptional regulator [Victivallales bacterium]|nr:GntR family transcriptional regulator [Victivallales bacterium]